MSRAYALTALTLPLLLLAGCDPVAVPPPAGVPAPPPAYPATTPNTQPAPPASGAGASPSHTAPTTQPAPPQVSGSQRTEYVWQKVMEGVAMGGAVAGPFGAGGGLIVGLITGLLTADAHYADLHAKIQTEQAKDRELEAQIEREIERQRELEAQLGGETPPAAAAANKGEDKQRAAEAGGDPQLAGKAAPERLVSVPKEARTQTPSASLPFKNVEVRDIDGDGVPDLWIYFSPLKPEEVVRQEEATRGDGRVDVWSYFKDGKLVRREVDTTANGRPDTIYHYDQEKLVKEERDEKGEGRVTYRAYYESGRLAQIERSVRASDKMDLRVYFDTTREGDMVLREERDLNGDGEVDIWSFYENGRLVRRDVSPAGLKYLSEGDAITAGPPPDEPELPPAAQTPAFSPAAAAQQTSR